MGAIAHKAQSPALTKAAHPDPSVKVREPQHSVSTQ